MFGLSSRLLLGLIMLLPGMASAIPCRFDGGTVNWSDVTSWDANGLCTTGGPAYPNNVGPNLFDVTLATNGEVILTETITIRDLSQTSSGVRLTGAQTLNVNGNTNISTGGWREATVNTNDATVTSSFSIDNGAAWNNNGTIVQTGGVINLNSELDGDVGTINNLVGGLFDSQNNTVISGPSNADGVGLFTNAGTFRKSGGNSNTTITSDFTNTATGVVDVQTGTINFSHSNGTIDNSGNLNTAAGTTIALNGNTNSVFNFNAGATTTGAGTLNLAAGTLQLNADHAINSNYQQSGSSGRIVGVHTLDLNGDATINTGGWREVTVNSNNATVTSSFSIDNGAAWNNNGTIVQTGGVINLNPELDGDVGTINNLVGGLFDSQNNTVISGPSNADGVGLFTNAGTFRKSGGNSNTTITSDFTNTATGVVDVQTGTINFSHSNGTIDNSGNLNTAAGTTIALNGNTNSVFNFNAGATTTGAGTLNLAAGTLQLNADHAINSNYQQSGSSGRIVGVHTLDLNGDATINTGGWREVTVNSNNATVTSSFSIDNGAAWNNNGTIVQTGGVINLNSELDGDVGTINNLVGGLFDSQNNTVISGPSNADGVGLFTNAGTFRKSGGNSNTTITSDFTNTATGVVDVQTGTINFSHSNGTIDNSGNFNTATGTTIALNGNANSVFNFDAGSTTTGGGRLLLSAGTLNINANHSISGDFTQSGSTSILQGGNTLTIGGITRISTGRMTEAGTTVTQGDAFLTSSFAIDGGHTLRHEGTTTWSGGVIGLNSSNSGADANAQGHWENTGTLINTNNTVINASQTIGGDGLFTNSGTFTKTGGSSTTTVDVLTNNSGLIAAESGTIRFTQAVDNSGVLRADGGNINFGSGTGVVTNSGTLNARDGSEVSFEATSVTANNVSGDLQGGIWHAQSTGAGATISLNGDQIQTNSAEIILDGAGSALRTHNTSPSNTFTSIEDSLALNDTDGTLRVLSNRDYSSSNSLNNSGVVELGGGNLDVASVNNSGEIFGQGTLADNVSNSGTVRASGGTLNANAGITGTTGTVQIDAGASLSLGANSNTGSLTHNGVDLNLGSNNFVISQDYTNADWASNTGNDFDARANVNGSGNINAVAGTTQSITGDVTNGNNAVVNLSLGNLREGDTIARTIQIQNSGTGAQLLGAIQNTNAGDLVVADQNFGPLASGASTGNISIGYTATAAGAVTGSIDVVNNFDNVANQQLVINNSAVYRMAQANVSGDLTGAGDLNFGTFLQSDGQQQLTITIANSQIAGLFSEDLGATFDNNHSGAGILNLDATGFNNIVAGDSSTLTLTLNPTSLGNVGGNVTANFVTAGAVNGVNIVGLDATSLPSQVLDLLGTIEGTVGQLAQPSQATPNPITGNIRVGGSIGQTLSIANTADDTFGESLSAAFGASTAPEITTTGNIPALAGGGIPDVSSLNVNVAGITAGNLQGSVELQLTSNGEFNSNTPTSLPAQQVAVDVDVFNIAAGAANNVALGDYHVDQGSVQGELIAQNTAAVTGSFTEELRVDVVGSSAGVTGLANGSLVSAGAGATLVGTAQINGSQAGNVAEMLTVQRFSDGSATSGILTDVDLGTQIVQVSGTGYRLATADVSQSAVAQFVRVGDSVQSTVTVANTATADAFSENLGAGSSVGNLDSIDAGSNGTLNLVLDTASVGVKNAGTTLTLVSDGTGINTLGQTSVGTQAVNASTTVTQLANPIVQSSYNFGNVRVGDSVASNISVNNTGAAAFTDLLLASFDQSTVGNGILTLSRDTISVAGDQQNNNLQITIDTGQAGTVATSAGVLLQSDGSAFGFGVTDLPPANIAVSGVVDLVGNVFNAAEAQVNNSTINLGAVRVGAASNSVNVSITNSAPTVMSESLNATAQSGTNNVAIAGAFNLLAAGTTDSNSIAVELESTATSGSFSGLATINFVSDGTGTSGLDPMALASQTVAVNGEVFNIAAGSVNNIALGDYHVAQGPIQANLTAQNTTAVSGGFTEDLRIDVIGSNTGFTSQGNGNLVGAGTGVNVVGNVQVGGNQAGDVAGTLTVQRFSDGSATSGILPDVDLGTQAVQVSGTGYRLATADVSQSAVAQFVRVGDSVQSTITLGNNAIADGFSENLNASSSVGNINSIAVGSTGTLNLALDTGSVGLKNAETTLTLASDGAGINTLGQTALGTQAVNASTTVTQLANPIVQSSYNFGNVRVGDGVASNISVNNAGAAAFTDLLLASFDQSTVGNGILALSSNTISIAGGQQNNNLQITIDTDQAGTVATSAGVLLQSDGSAFGFGVTDLPPANVAVFGVVDLVGNVFNAAQAQINNATINLGAVRIGEASNSVNVSITNSAPVEMSESLNAAAQSGTNNISSSGDFNLLTAGQTDNSSVAVGLQSTATSGSFNGLATIDFVSDGTGTSGLTPIALPSQTVAVNGNVYALAAADLQTQNLDFGVVRIGEQVNTQDITLRNSASGALVDDLRVGDNGGTDAFALTGSPLTLAAGESGLLYASLNTATAGVFNEARELNFASHNSELTDVSLAVQSIQLTGTVNNLADLLFSSILGPGALTQTSNGDYLYDFGDLIVGTTATAELGVGNGAVGPADNLNLLFVDLGAGSFGLAGFDNILGLMAGEFQNGLLASITSSSLGLIEDSLSMQALSVFQGLTDLTLGNIALTLRANFIEQPSEVAEPGAFGLMLLGLVVLMLRRRQRQR